MWAFIDNIKVSLIEAVDFLKNPEQTTKFIGTVLNIIFILIITKLSLKIMYSIINKFFDTQKSLKLKVSISRMETMKGLTNSIVKYIVYFIAFTSIIKIFGVEIAPLIATAGIGGLALGFGAQNLVKDIITGFFILFEEQFSVGDYVGIDDISGTVEEMTLRVTKIRDFNGDLHIVPNGEITRVTNKSNGKMRAMVDISITHEEDIDNTIKILNEVSKEIKKESSSIIEGPTVLGVTGLLDSEVVLTIVAKTIPMEQWAVERLMRKKFKEAFNKYGIKVPYPKRVFIDNKK